MASQTQKPRSSRVQQLKRSEIRKYTSFYELGLASPEFEDNEKDEGVKLDEKLKEQPGGNEGASGLGGGEMKGGQGARMRSGSMRLMEWLMRPRACSSPP